MGTFFPKRKNFHTGNTGEGKILTEAEQNRLIIKHMPMVANIAANYRGQKGIPFEDLEAAGREGLVKAARKWRSCGDFVGFAVQGIDLAIFDFVRDWKNLEVVGANLDEIERYFWEWQTFFHTPYESWTRLAATPEDLVILYENMRERREALSSAMIGLNKRERQMIHARFFREPSQTLNSIARDHKISYARTVFIIRRALHKLQNVLNSLGNKTETQGI